MTIRLIVNADDYGRSANVSRGIRESCSRGIVRSTTCMMNMPTVAEDIEIALRDTPELGLGVHLLLTAGWPILPASQVSSLVGPDGSFLKQEQLIARHADLDPGEAKAEWHAQIEKFIAIAGRKPTHIDSHHHVTYFTPGLFQSMLELAKEYDLPVRLPVAREAQSSLLGVPGELARAILEHGPRLLAQFRPPHPDAFFASFYDDLATQAELFRLLDGLSDGTFEIMAHPGYSDPELAAGSGYAAQRERELAVLTDAATLAEIKKRGIELISFAQL